MRESRQTEFIFVDGWTPASNDARAEVPTLDQEIGSAWRVPVSRRVQVSLRNHDVPGAEGLLEIAKAPDWPFDANRPLHLRIGHVVFTSRQIESWTLL